MGLHGVREAVAVRDPAREHRVASMTGTALTLYMYGYFQEANTQLPPPAPIDALYERMLEWARVRRTTT